MTTIAFFLIPPLPWAGGPALAMLVWSLWRFRDYSKWRTVTIAICASMATYVIVGGAYFSLLLRDGLKPGFVPSEGLEAVVRFLQMFLLFLGVSVIPAAAAAILAHRSSNLGA